MVWMTEASPLWEKRVHHERRLSCKRIVLMLLLGTGAGAVLAQQSQKVDLAADIYFAPRSAVLDAPAKAAVRSLAQRAAVVDLLALSIVGHADKREGPDAQAQRLSERRALAVKQALSAYGIADRMMYAEGKGATQPIRGGASAEGRAKNRRVEIEGMIKSKEGAEK